MDGAGSSLSREYDRMCQPYPFFSPHSGKHISCAHLYLLFHSPMPHVPYTPLLILYKLLALIRTAMNRYRVVVEIHRPSPTASYWPGAYSP